MAGSPPPLPAGPEAGIVRGMAYVNVLAAVVAVPQRIAHLAAGIVRVIDVAGDVGARWFDRITSARIAHGLTGGRPRRAQAPRG